MPRLAGLYRDDPDAGVDGAAEWVLFRWLTADEFSRSRRVWCGARSSLLARIGALPRKGT